MIAISESSFNIILITYLPHAQTHTHTHTHNLHTFCLYLCVTHTDQLVCVCVFSNTRTNTSCIQHTHTHTYTCQSVCMYVCASARARACVCMCVCVCAFVYVLLSNTYHAKRCFHDFYFLSYNTISLFESFMTMSTMDTTGGTNRILPHHTKRGITLDKTNIKKTDLKFNKKSKYSVWIWY